METLTHQELTQEHYNELKTAKTLLENPGLVAKLSNMVGSPVEKGIKLLPSDIKEVIFSASQKSLTTALNTALYTLRERPKDISSNRFHKIAATVSGAVGGAFGLPALLLELPFSTTIMLRSIADIARQQGEDLVLQETRLACLEVFALGGRSGQDDATESGYFSVRAGLAKSVSDAAKHVAAQGLKSNSAPALARFISQVTSRFSVPVSEKIAAQAMPVLGAAGGAAINSAFISHYQQMALGHFTVRRLERIYSAETIRRVYSGINFKK